MTQILPRFYRRTLARQDQAAVDKAVNESVDNTPVAGATAPGDRRKLRGIPVAGGATGTSPGTDPFLAVQHWPER